jgi:hypothetical protein
MAVERRIMRRSINCSLRYMTNGVTIVLTAMIKPKGNEAGESSRRLRHEKCTRNFSGKPLKHETT